MDTKVDFTCSYHEEGNWHLIRPENEAAQKELDDNLGEYAPYLMRWYDHNGDSWWIRVAPGRQHAWTTKGNSPIYTNLKRDPNELVKKLFEKGFKLALDKTNWKPKQQTESTTENEKI
jgi:hypothetical protein